MKKILIIGFIIFCIFQMIVMATAIDIGRAAVDGNETTGTHTVVNKANPANESGTITSVEIWANSNLSNCEVATFYVVSGNFLSTRDTHTIGSVTAGSKQTFSGLSIDVEAGDYIGMYYTAGIMEMTSGGAGVWLDISTDRIPCTNHEFGVYSYEQSLYGIGETAAAEEDNAIFFGFSF